MTWKQIGLMLLATLFTTPAQIFYKIGANKLPEIVTNWPLGAAIILYFIAALLFIWALREGQLIKVFPIFSTTYIWVTLTGLFIFHETVTLLNWIGIGIIMVGVSFVAGSKHA